MGFIDTHAHLNDFEAYPDYKEVIESLPEFNIEKVIVIGNDKESSIGGEELTRKYKNIFATVGTHPNYIEELNDEVLEKYLYLVKSNKKIVAVGETGLDYHYEGFSKNLQKEAFLGHIKVALEGEVPIVIHIRDAYEDALKILKDNKNLIKHGALLHCYSGSVEYMQEILKLGFDIAIGGAVTFKNANKLLDVAMACPLDRLHLETDCPYLCPDRGKRNEPRYVAVVAEKIAGLKGIRLDELENAVKENAYRLFPRMR